MKALLSRALLVLMIMCSFGFAFGSASAEDILKDACAGDSKNSATCQSTSGPNNNPLTGKNGTLYKITRLIAVIAGVVAVIIIIVSGLMYVTAAGDTQKITSAKNTLIGAIVGLVVIALAQSIITFVVSRL